MVADGPAGPVQTGTGRSVAPPGPVRPSSAVTPSQTRAAQPPSGTSHGTRRRAAASRTPVSLDASSAWSRFRAAGQSIAPAWRRQARPHGPDDPICGPAAATGALGTTAAKPRRCSGTAEVIVCDAGTLDTPVRPACRTPSGRKRSWVPTPTRRGGWALRDTPGLVPGRT